MQFNECLMFQTIQNQKNRSFYAPVSACLDLLVVYSE